MGVVMGLGHRPFNSIEWIPGVMAGIAGVLVAELSIPLNGFSFLTTSYDLTPCLKTLSIPLNGFLLNGLLPSLAPLRQTFNSIEWIRSSNMWRAVLKIFAAFNSIEWIRWGWKSSSRG